MQYVWIEFKKWRAFCASVEGVLAWERGWYTSVSGVGSMPAWVAERHGQHGWCAGVGKVGGALAQVTYYSE